MNRLGVIQILLASFCFGFLGLFSRWATQLGLTTGFLLTYRFAFAFLGLGLFLLLTRPRVLILTRNQFVLSLALGLLGYAVFATLYFWSIEQVSIPLAAMLLYTYPFWIYFFHLLMGHKLQRKEWTALSIASLGLVLLLWGQVTVNSFTGILFGLGSAITYAIYILVSHRHQQNQSPWAVSVYVMMGSSLGLFLFHRPSLPPWQMSLEQTGLVLGMALLCSVVPLSLVLSSLQKIPSTRVSLLSLFEPVTAALAAALIFNETLGSIQILGALLVLGALVYNFIHSQQSDGS